MIVLLDLEKKVISYQTTTPFVQGTDSRNIIKLLVPHSEVVDSFDAQIAYVLQSGRTTIKVANSGMEDTTETINDVIYNIINFDLPRMVTSLAGNLVATLFITTSTGEKYKFNVLNNVLEAAEVEALEEALADDEVATALDTLESVVALLQSQMANRVINGVNGVPLDVSTDYELKLSSNDVSLTLNADGDEDNGNLSYDKTTGNERRVSDVYVGDYSASISYRHIYNDNHANDTVTEIEVTENEITAYSEEFVFAKNNRNNTNPYFSVKKNNFSNVLELYISKGGSYPTLVSSGGNVILFNDELTSNIVLDDNGNVILNPVGDGKLKVNNTHNVLDDRNIVDGLNSTSTTDVLSANQGKVLNEKIFANSIVLSGESGTLTTEQMDIITSYKTPVIYYINDVGDINALHYSYKNEIETSQYVYGFNDSYIAGGSSNYRLYIENSITINSVTRAWTFEKKQPNLVTKQALDNTVISLEGMIDDVAHTIVLSIDSDYKLTASLKDANNNVISTSNVIDLPLESIVTSATYYNSYTYDGVTYTKVIVITLSTTDVPTIIPVGDLVSGLQSEITSSNKLDSDLVDDTNQAHKFVTADEKAQITINENAISAIKDGTTIDSFADVETALNTKLDKTAFNALGLSVVDGCLCVTYEE